MYTQAEKPTVNKSRVVANSATQKKNSSSRNNNFIDNRDETLVQAKMISIIQNSSSPILQLKTNAYRAVKSRKNKDLGNSAWRIDSDGLSTFETVVRTDTRPYKLEFRIDADRTDEIDKEMGDGNYENRPSGAVEDLSGATGSYTPEHGGEGHWSISGVEKSAITTYARSDSASNVSDI